MRFCTLQRNAAAQIARRLALGAALLSATIVSSFAQTPRTFTPTDEAPEDYPAANGREETFYACTACHGFKLVAQQGMTRAQWDDSLNWMTTKHGMNALEGDDRKLILDYLETQYPPVTRTGGRDSPNPFLK
jgi:mono/diheme cytochrome c family protein